MDSIQNLYYDNVNVDIFKEDFVVVSSSSDGDIIVDDNESPIKTFKNVSVVIDFKIGMIQSIRNIESMCNYYESDGEFKLEYNSYAKFKDLADYVA